MDSLPSIPDRRHLRVLHVVEALGGGVMVALRDYIDNCREDVEHIVLARLRGGTTLVISLAFEYCRWAAADFLGGLA